jgi:DNA polymerase-3 subunit alpha
MGFIKFDMLAINQLNIIDEARRLIKANRGVDVDPNRIPMGDAKALKQLNSHDGLCIFQFDTKLAGEVTDRMRGIRQFEDLAALSTLMRPSALSNGFDRKFGELRDTRGGVYIPDCLKPYLQDTYGLPIYQEHIMQAAIALAGFDKVTAYKFMKKCYKNHFSGKDEIEQWKVKFIEGAKRKSRHKAIEVELDNGETKIFEYDELVKCTDGVQRTIKKVIEGDFEIET